MVYKTYWSKGENRCEGLGSGASRDPALPTDGAGDGSDL